MSVVLKSKDCNCENTVVECHESKNCKVFRRIDAYEEMKKSYADLKAENKRLRDAIKLHKEEFELEYLMSSNPIHLKLWAALGERDE